MNCNCKWFEAVLALVLLVITIWPNIFGVVANKWLVIIAAVLLLLHAWRCNNCGSKSTKKR